MGQDFKGMPDYSSPSSSAPQGRSLARQMFRGVGSSPPQQPIAQPGPPMPNQMFRGAGGPPMPMQRAPAPMQRQMALAQTLRGPSRMQY